MPILIMTERLVIGRCTGRQRGDACGVLRPGRHALRARRAERVVAIVDPANQRSTRVLRRIGMTPAGTASYFGREWLLSIMRPQASPTE